MVQERAQAQRRKHDDEEPEGQRQGITKSAGIDEETACCLADIDQVLEEAQQESEEEKALREWNEGVHTEKFIRVWNATYAHLGFKAHYSCCQIVVMKGDNVVATK